MSNIYSVELKSQKFKNANARLFSFDNENNEENVYLSLMSKWNSNIKVWAYHRHHNRLVGMSLEEFNASLVSDMKFRIFKKSMECLKCNNTENTTDCDNRKWYQLVVQPTNDDLMEFVGLCPMSLSLFGLMVDGWVYHFENENDRDEVWCKINKICVMCKETQSYKHNDLCVGCAKKILNKDITHISLQPQDEVTQIINKIKKEDAERMANEWGEWLLKNEPEPIKVVIKPKNPPKNPNRKNIPAKPPAFVRSPAGCQISNHLAVKKWMDKYGNK